MSEKVKLFFRLPDDAPYATESVWSEHKTNDSLVVLNSPFYVKGISYLDEVDFTVEDGLMYFKNVLKKGGHSTYRILQRAVDQKKTFEEFWGPLEKIGCTYESKVDNDRILYSVDVPPTTDIKEAYAFLEKGEQVGAWVFEEADYGVS